MLNRLQKKRLSISKVIQYLKKSRISDERFTKLKRVWSSSKRFLPFFGMLYLFSRTRLSILHVATR